MAHNGNRGRGRGQYRGRGRGRGMRGNNSPNYRGQGRGKFGGQSLQSYSPSPLAPDVDFEGDFESFNLFAGHFAPAARAQPRRARGNHSIVDRGYISRPRISSRGLGYKRTPHEEQLFKQWESTRPLLQPVKFVPATAHRTLFEQIDEILQVPHTTTEAEDKDVPSEGFHNPIDEATDAESIVEPSKSSDLINVTHTIQFSGGSALNNEEDSEHQTHTEAQVVADVVPEQDIIVYDPPRPHTPTATPLSLERIEAGRSDAITLESLTFSFQKNASLHSPIKADSPRRVGKRLQTRKQMDGTPIRFGSFGSRLEEEHLQSSSDLELRREGSDIDWGDNDGDDDDESAALDADESADMLDPDVDEDAFGGFLKSIRALSGTNQVTIDDLDDIRQLGEEDEGSDSVSSGSEEQVDIDEGDEESAEDVSESESLGDTTDPEGTGLSFQARLHRLREHSRKAPGYDQTQSVESSEEDAEDLIDEHDALVSELQELIDGHDAMFQSGSRKARKMVFNAAVADDNEYNFKTKRGQIIPPELLGQWERDRAKKAEYKRARQVARFSYVMETKGSKKRGKKNKRDLLRAGLADPDSEVRTDKVALSEVATLIQDFVADLSRRESLVLPAMDKESRAKVHRIAAAYNLKSRSQGKGDSRFTTLYRTSKTGIGVKDWKVYPILFGGKGKKVVKHREGEIVGKSAPKIGEGNIGFRLLQQMGWQDGHRIGVSGGIEAPVAAVIKTTKLGLGAAR